MKIFIGADHRGFELKEKMKGYLEDLGYQVEDLGNKILDNDDDYPDYGIMVGKAVVENNGMGIVICGSGEGIAISSNKIPGVRCALAWNTEVAKQSREHLDANVLALPADFLSEEEAKVIVKVFLETKFSEEERHKRRIWKLK